MKTTAAVFCASYADWKLIKTRGCVQVIFEIPLEQADLAYQVVGGMPSPAQERWFAIAGLEMGTGAVPTAHVPREARDGLATETSPPPASRLPPPRRPVAPEKRLAQQAGILCADPVFRRFLYEAEMCPGLSEEEAAIAVRFICGVRSRSQIIPESSHGYAWERLYSQFTAWKLAPELIDS